MSSSDIIITVENLSKRYKLGVIGATSLRESVERGLHRLRGRDWREHMGKVGIHSPQRAQRTQSGRDASINHEDTKTRSIQDTGCACPGIPQRLQCPLVTL